MTNPQGTMIWDQHWYWSFWYRYWALSLEACEHQFYQLQVIWCSIKEICAEVQFAGLINVPYRCLCSCIRDSDITHFNCEKFSLEVGVEFKGLGVFTPFTPKNYFSAKNNAISPLEMASPATLKSHEWLFLVKWEIVTNSYPVEVGILQKNDQRNVG